MDSQKKTLADLVMQEIGSRKITLHKKTFFTQRQLLLWVSSILMIFIGGHSLGMLIYFIREFEFSLLSIYLRTPDKIILLTSIFMWFLFLIGGGIWSWIQYRKTKWGYRTETLKLLALLVLGISFIGVLSYKTEFSVHLDKAFGKYLPIYQSWETTKIKVWSQPERGLLFGIVSEVHSETEITLQDATGLLWTIHIEKARIPPRVSLREGVRVKLIGVADNQAFTASEVRPWKGQRHGKGRCFGYEGNLTECAKSHQFPRQSSPERQSE